VKHSRHREGGQHPELRIPALRQRHKVGTLENAMDDEVPALTPEVSRGGAEDERVAHGVRGVQPEDGNNGAEEVHVQPQEEVGEQA